MKPETHIPTAEYAEKHPVLANPGETRLMQHMPQLDGVRAIAVLMVIWHHFMPHSIAAGGVAPWGAIGVGLFFTLSGFLITRILLNCRIKIDDQRSTVGRMMKQFYMRRFLRIFPLYYAVLLVLFIVNPINYDGRRAPKAGDTVRVVVERKQIDGTFVRVVNKQQAEITLPDGDAQRVPRSGLQVEEAFRERAWWHVAYLSNVRFSFWRRAGEIERHLWSLSVEEQFYLLWPLLILLMPRRLLLPLILLTIAAAPVWRIVTYEQFKGLLVHEWMMPGCLDLLGAGALLALLSLPQFGYARLWNGLVGLCGMIGLPLFLIFVTAAEFGRAFEWPGGATYPITAIAAVWIIGSASRGFKGPLGWLLASPPLVYIGRISYGLYVLHMFVPHIVDHFFGWEGASDAWTRLFTYTAVSIVAASVSWFAFEAPINGLKRYFEYDKTARTSPATSN